MRSGRLWAKVDSPLELSVSTRPIPFKPFLHEPQVRVCLGKRAIDCQRLHRCGLGLWPGFGRCKITGVPQKNIRAGKAGMGQSVARVLLDGLREEVCGFLEIGSRPLVPIEKALQIELIGRGIYSGLLCEPLFLFASKLWTQQPVDLRFDVLLQGYQLRNLAVVLLPP